MISFDLTLKWRRSDQQIDTFPATVCYDDERVDGVQLRAEAVVDAITANITDFPDDLGDEPTLLSVQFEETS